MLGKHLFGTFHRWAGNLKTAECHDWVYKEPPWTAQVSTGKDGARLTTVKNCAPQRALARNLVISSPADQNIPRRFTESGEITECKPDQRPMPRAPNPVKDVTMVALNTTVSSRSYHGTFTQEWWTLLSLQEKHLWRHQLLSKQHL